MARLIFRTIPGIAATSVLLTGCGSDLAKVSGTVRLDGKPLDRGTVTFRAEDQAMAVGQIASDGKFQMKTGTQWGVAPGSYRVTVSAYQTRPSEDDLGEPIPILLTPARYNSEQESGLRAEVKPGSNQVNLSLISTPTESAGD